MYIDSRMDKEVVMYFCNEISCSKAKGVKTDMCNHDISHRFSTERKKLDVKKKKAHMFV